MQAALGLSPLVRLEKADRQQKERTGGLSPRYRRIPTVRRSLRLVSEKLTEEPSPCQKS